MGDKGQKVPCRFFYMPGIDEEEIIKKDEHENILNGELTCTLSDKVSSSLKILIRFNKGKNITNKAVTYLQLIRRRNISCYKLLF